MKKSLFSSSFLLVSFLMIELLLFTRCQESQKNINQIKNEKKTPKFTHKKVTNTNKDTNEVFIDSFNIYVFKVENEWGYDIYQNNKLLIHQPTIPAIEGVKGFSSDQKAKITATYIVQKLRSGIFPPVISIVELKALNVIQ